MDYGCGKGSYSNSYIDRNPNGKTYMVDRNIGDNIDFEKSPNWYIDKKNTFDIVLLSEILHCKNVDGQKYLLDSSDYVLKSKGLLRINENVDPFMDWRLNRLTDKGKLLDESYIVQLMFNYNFKLKNINSINYHKIYTYEKI